MTFKELVESTYTNGDLEEIIASSKNLKEVCAKLNYSNHGRNTKFLRGFAVSVDIDIKHFTTANSEAVDEDRICPICSKVFSVRVTSKKRAKQVTCSVGCANTHFRSGERQVILKVLMLKVTT